MALCSLFKSGSGRNIRILPSVLVFNGCESGVGVLPRFWVEDPRGGGSSRVGDFFRRSTFFVAGVSVTHPVHLTRLQIPNFVWCGVNLLLFPQRVFPFSLLEDPDKKWQFTFVLSPYGRDAWPRGPGGRNCGCCSPPLILMYYPSAGGG